MAPGHPNGGWNFDHGQEFPGATGGPAAEPDPPGQDQPLLVLTADFTKGGNYAQAGRGLPPVYFDRLAFRLKTPGSTVLTLRLVNGAVGSALQRSVRLCSWRLLNTA